MSEPRIIAEEWPAVGLETVAGCPACGCSERSLMHTDLQDRVFYAAPGRWSMWRCSQCRSAYLDPRPTEDTIGMAYETYYTHAAAQPPEPGTSLTAKLRTSLGNGYRNSRYGTNLKPAMPLGKALALLVPQMRRRVDLIYRYLPKPGTMQPRLLDVGCGDGSFLRLARSAGWEVCGVDPDPSARQVASESGLDVRPSIEDWSGSAGTFGYVTIAHVIEHLHHPADTLSRVFELIGAGGGIYVDTPNVDAVSHHMFGADWRGLEPPRHLLLFTRDSLAQVVRQAGFQRVRFYDRSEVFDILAEQSQLISQRRDPYGTCIGANALTIPNGTQHDFLTLTAHKP